MYPIGLFFWRILTNTVIISPINEVGLFIPTGNKLDR